MKKNAAFRCRRLGTPPNYTQLRPLTLQEVEQLFLRGRSILLCHLRLEAMLGYDVHTFVFDLHVERYTDDELLAKGYDGAGGYHQYLMDKCEMKPKIHYIDPWLGFYH